MIIKVNKGVDLNSINTQALFTKINKCMHEYQQLVLLKQEKPHFRNYCIDNMTRIFEESPYDDIWDFTYDFNRYNMGLPLFIDFKIVQEV